MTPRIHVESPLAASDDFLLPPQAARHVQVLRLQPDAELRLFDGRGGQWRARVLRMGRSEVAVQVLVHEAQDLELPWAVTLAIGMPANERMDALVEKATELGVAAIQPLVCERSVLRLAGERAERRAQHWQAVAVAACEQCGRDRVPAVAAPLPLSAWLRAGSGPAAAAWVLSLAPGSLRPAQRTVPADALTVLSGPEGGLSPAEEAQALAHGFLPVGLGPRVLRADTAPLALLAWLGLQAVG
ncbi:RNA methyltransferase, RsmE family [Burkholderiales bacterium JOSHI_001]|nr:RNA methyltransferase, RsmE family [Burkholderiales bacterium JOSHI_001]